MSLKLLLFDQLACWCVVSYWIELYAFNYIFECVLWNLGAFYSMNGEYDNLGGVRFYKHEIGIFVSLCEI